MPTAIAAPITRVSVSTQWRALLFVTVSAIALAAAPPRAAADDECGAPAAGAVTCPVDDVGPDYPAGITYNAAEDLTINVDDGVSVIGTAGVTLNNSAGNGAVAAPGVTIDSDASGIEAINSADGDATVTAAGSITAAGDFGLSASTAGAGNASATFGPGTLAMSQTGATGVRALATGAGNATASSSGDITLSAGGTGVSASAASGAALAESTGTVTIVSTAGSDGVLANSVDGAATATATGLVSTDGPSSRGVTAESVNSTATASAADVTTTGEFSAGVTATANNDDASATATGAVSTAGANSRGVTAESSLGAATASTADVTTLGDNSIGASALSQDGAATVNATGAISTSGLAAMGASAISTAGDASANVASVSTLGEGAIGVFAQSGTGAADVAATGAISTEGAAAHGVQATADGPVSVDVMDVSTLTDGSVGILATSNAGELSVTSGGLVSTAGADAIGISAIAPIGPVTVNAADVSTLGDNATGILAESAGPVSVNATGVVSTAGAAANAVLATSDAEVTVNVAGASTLTDGSAAILAESTAGAVSVASSGAISTAGADAAGVMAMSPVGPVTVNVTDVATLGDNSSAVIAQSDAGAVEVISAGAITAEGAGSHGIVAVSAGPVTLDVGDVTVTGEGSSGVIALSSGDIVDVTVSGNVQGGWAAPADPPAEAPAIPLPEGPLPFAAGVVISSGGEAGAATLNNNGEIGALSDTAVLAYAPSITVNNAGTVTGEVFLFGDEVTFNNTSSDSFDVRNFADTDGDGIRETEGVSISDFGGAGVFNNDAAGAVNLLNVAGATAFDPAGALVPEYGLAANYDITVEGVEQGQLTNLAQFNHAGSIVLQDALTGGAGPVAGDVFAIIGGEGGPAEFVSNGGSLFLDAFLDEGGVEGTFSDVLILDAVTLGSGATQVFIADAGGGGALTIDDGILLVDVLDPAASAAGAFVLGEPVIAGAFQYELFQGGDPDAGGDPDDGNWYLRSDLSPTTDLYRTMPASMLRFGRETIGTLQQRVGDRWWRVPERQVERTVTDPAPPPAAAPCPQTDFTVYFEWDKYDLNQEANETINAALSRARQCSVQQVMVIGHTDTSGSAEYNMGLSQRRADVVENALIAGGLAAGSIQTEARGETDLARPTPDGVREPLNRRSAVTIRVSGSPQVAGPPPAPRTRTVVETIPASVEVQGLGVWGRVVGTDGEFESDDERGVSADENTWLAQAGVDFLISQSESGTLIGSVFGHYGEIDTDVSNFDFGEIGSFESSGYGLGGGVTWYSPSGAYADGQLSYTWLDNELSSDVLGPLSDGEFDGTVWVASIEGGYRYEMSPNYYVVPQAQLIYGDADFDDFTDAFGADVSVDDGDSLVGRLGVAIEYMSLASADDGNVSRLQAYGIANLYYEFMGDTGVSVEGINLTDEGDEFWGELGGGLTYAFNGNWSIYAEGGYRTSLENWGDSHVLRGNLGVRYNW